MLDLSAYRISFEDEFEATPGAYLDTGTWLTRYWWGGRSLSTNGEMQYFADRSTRLIKTYPELDPFRIVADPLEPGDGILTITANVSPKQSLSDGLPYVSGMINTYGSFAQTYGYFEISAQVPSGQGLWPAFWLLPADGSWPPEIDVMEFLGHDPDTYYVGSHWTDGTGAHVFQTNPVDVGFDLSAGFHRYGMLWTAETITFFLDGEEVGSMATPDGMDKPMYLLVGLAVGGNWPGAPDASTAFPAEFRIDYVRAWTLDAAPVLTPTQEGDAGNNRLTGGAGNDVIFGHGGADTIEGLAGADTLAGGAGADVFVYVAAAPGQDLILDFDPAGGDVVRISKAVAGVKNFSGLYRNVSDTPSGDAVLKLAGGASITFDGVTKAQLGYDDFLLA